MSATRNKVKVHNRFQKQDIVTRLRSYSKSLGMMREKDDADMFEEAANLIERQSEQINELTNELIIAQTRVDDL